MQLGNGAWLTRAGKGAGFARVESRENVEIWRKQDFTDT